MRYSGFILIFFLQTAFSANYPVKIGNTTVIIQKIARSNGKNFVHLHQNETTALTAAKAIVTKNGGSILTLVHPGQRNVIFHIHNKRYEFDPNRIFTDRGIQKTLQNFGGYTLQAHKEVKKLADQIKLHLPAGKIVAVHNNKSYSFKDYLPGQNLAADAQDLQIKDGQHYRNFYLVTQLQDYRRIKKLNFNGIWQAKNAADDGSLSIFLAGRNYVNVEAGYNQLSAQIRMLQQV